MKFDIFKITQGISNRWIRNKALDAVFTWGIPFNRGMGLKIKTLSPDFVEIEAIEKTRRKNHIGGAHACFLTLLSEYPAGLLLAQNFSPEKYRLILKELHIDYQKQGKGALYSKSNKPESFPEFKDGQTFIDMVTEIFNQNGDLVSTCQTKWQLKEWNKVGKRNEPTKH